MDMLKKSSSIATIISLALIFLCLSVPTMRPVNVHAQLSQRSPLAERLEREDDSIDISRYVLPDLASASPDRREELDHRSSSGGFLTMDEKGAGAASP